MASPIAAPSASEPVFAEATGRSESARISAGSMTYGPMAEPMRPTAVTSQQIASGMIQCSRSMAEAAIKADSKIMCRR